MKDLKQEMPNKIIESDRARFQVESGIDHAGRYFEEIHKQFTSEMKLVECQQYKNTDTQVSLLWVDDKIAAFVIEARSAFNHVELVKGVTGIVEAPESVTQIAERVAVEFAEFSSAYQYNPTVKTWMKSRGIMDYKEITTSQLFKLFKENQNG